MDKRRTTFRMLLALLLILTGVIWAIIGMLLVAGSARNAEGHGRWWTILLVILWLGGLAACIGGAVRLVRPVLQQLSTRLEKPRRS